MREVFHPSMDDQDEEDVNDSQQIVDRPFENGAKKAPVNPLQSLLQNTTLNNKGSIDGDEPPKNPLASLM